MIGIQSLTKTPKRVTFPFRAPEQCSAYRAQSAPYSDSAVLQHHSELRAVRVNARVPRSAQRLRWRTCSRRKTRRRSKIRVQWPWGRRMRAGWSGQYLYIMFNFLRSPRDSGHRTLSGSEYLPRGSNPTTSNCGPTMVLKRSPPGPWIMSTPLPPGPPGLKRIGPL
jgi:hypothetical protein